MIAHAKCVFARTVRRLGKFSTVGERLEALHKTARTRGWLSMEAVSSTLKEISKQKQACSPEDALMLIRSSGSLLIYELPSVRQLVSERMFRELRHCLQGNRFQLAHVNSFLRVGIQNGRQPTTFLKPDFLLKQFATNESPNDMTWQLALEWECLNGNTDKALTMLKHIDTFSSRAFSLLAYSNILNKNTGEALAILEEQEKHMGSGGDPLMMIVKVMATADAKGDNKATRLLQSYTIGEHAKSPFPHRSYEPLAYLLSFAAANNFTVLYGQCLDYISNHGWPILTLALRLASVCQELLVMSRHIEAHQLMLSFPSNLHRLVWRMLARAHATSCVRLSVDPACCCEHLLDRDLEQAHYFCHSILRESLVRGDLDFLKWLCKNTEFQIKIHYFYPLFRKHGYSDERKFIDILMLACEQLGSDQIRNDTFFNYELARCLMERGKSPAEINAMYRSAGLDIDCEQIVQESHLHVFENGI